MSRPDPDTRHTPTEISIIEVKHKYSPPSPPPPPPHGGGEGGGCWSELSHDLASLESNKDHLTGPGHFIRREARSSNEVDVDSCLASLGFVLLLVTQSVRHGDLELFGHVQLFGPE